MVAVLDGLAIAESDRRFQVHGSVGRVGRRRTGGSIPSVAHRVFGCNASQAPLAQVRNGSMLAALLCTGEHSRHPGHHSPFHPSRCGKQFSLIDLLQSARPLHGRARMGLEQQAAGESAFRRLMIAVLSSRSAYADIQAVARDHRCILASDQDELLRLARMLMRSCSRRRICHQFLACCGS